MIYNLNYVNILIQKEDVSVKVSLKNVNKCRIGDKKMLQTDLYEVMFKRKSIRKYDLDSLDKNELMNISAYMSTLKSMYNNIKTEFKIVSQNDVKSLLPWKAPHYIVAFSEVKDGYLTNMGFILQQMDLYFSANGIGSCWQGWPKPTKEIKNDSNLEFIIVIAFGKPAEPLYRGSVSEFKRKPFEQITSITDMKELLEPVRLAPSTRQPWFFTGREGIIHAYCIKTGFIKALERFNKLEMGIGLCHLWIAAQHFGKEIEFINDKEAQNDAPGGYYYVTSLRVKY